MRGDRVHQALTELGKFKCRRSIKFSDLGEVGAGREEMLVARKDHRGGCAQQLKHCVHERHNARTGEAIGVVGRGQSEDGGGCLGLALDEGGQGSGDVIDNC